mmetsp:Transcript_23775/g.60070  ORF Transcript_23775/g.60070 Transcript_23775/m.60070 type:complete len:263 (+) Transcript_23775:736-1524(+)
MVATTGAGTPAPWCCTPEDEDAAEVPVTTPPGSAFTTEPKAPLKDDAPAPAVLAGAAAAVDAAGLTIAPPIWRTDPTMVTPGGEGPPPRPRPGAGASALFELLLEVAGAEVVRGSGAPGAVAATAATGTATGSGVGAGTTAAATPLVEAGEAAAGFPCLFAPVPECSRLFAFASDFAAFSFFLFAFRCSSAAYRAASAADADSFTGSFAFGSERTGLVVFASFLSVVAPTCGPSIAAAAAPAPAATAVPASAPGEGPTALPD